jgi:hypothetical protein
MRRPQSTADRPAALALRLAGWLVPLLVAGGGRPAGAVERCTLDYGPPSVRFEVKLGDIAYHNDRGRSEFQRLSPKAAALGAQWVTSGLTVDEIKLNLSVEVTAMRRADGRYCVALGAAAGSLGYDAIHVFIDRRYRPGSCQYQSILDHELKHVVVHAEAVRRYGAAMEARLRETSGSYGAFVAPSPQAGAEWLNGWLDRELRPLFHDMQRGIDRADAVLDSRENYEREQKQCPTW